MLVAQVKAPRELVLRIRWALDERGVDTKYYP